jgi:hypothetical protein
MNAPSNEAPGSPTAAGPDWDPAAALARVAGPDVQRFTERVHAAAAAYARSPDSHLTFEEVQAVANHDAAARSEHSAHLVACEFCRGLLDTLATPDTARQEFADFVRDNEPASGSTSVSREPEAARSNGIFGWPLRRRGDQGSGLNLWGLALAAALVVGIGLGSVGTVKYQNAMTSVPKETPPIQITASKLVVEPSPDWTSVRDTCAQQTGQSQPCALFADAARLQVEGKAQTARPVVVDALKKSGVSSTVVAHVDRTLETTPAADPAARERATSEARAVLTANEKPSPDTLLQAAKLQFEGGQPVLGYDSLRQYVAVDNPKAGRALELGFVQPVAVVRALGRHASVEPPTSGSSADVASQSLAADAAAASDAPEAKN